MAVGEAHAAAARVGWSVELPVLDTVWSVCVGWPVPARLNIMLFGFKCCRGRLLWGLIHNDRCPRVRVSLRILMIHARVTSSSDMTSTQT